MSFLDEITVITINYNSEYVIEKCLRPLSGVAEIIIVDNASSSSSVEFIRKNFSGATLILNQKNLGYGCAVNQAFRQSKTKYTLVVSPDTEITTEEVRSLFDAAQIYDNAAILAPSLEVPRFGNEIWVMGPDELGHQRADFDASGPFCSWFVAGTIMFCPTKRFLHIGGFDENMFLYMEDLELAKRVTQAGYTMIYVPDIKARHLNGRSTPPSMKLHWRKDWNFAWGDLYVTEKFKGKFACWKKAWKYLQIKGPKSLLYLLVLNRKRFIRDFAAIHGVISYLMNRKAPHQR